MSPARSEPHNHDHMHSRAVTGMRMHACASGRIAPVPVTVCDYSAALAPCSWVTLGGSTVRTVEFTPQLEMVTMDAKAQK